MPVLKKSAAPEALKLTSLSSCAGCAAKLGQVLLRQMVADLPAQQDDPRLLVGANTGDDAGVYLLNERTAIVQTVDFFTPIVDDALDYGRIAATNALSDVYAMGGRPITAMNIVGVPVDKVSPQAMGRILRGGALKVKEAGCLLVGGHTIKSLEPIYGLSVTGVVHPKRVMTNAKAEPGDLLVLTKPLGVGIATTGLKRNIASPRLMKKAVAVMTHLNKVGALVAEKGLVRAATDVTGFGISGHLGSMCLASEVGAEIDVAALPVLDPEVLQLIQSGCVPGGTSTNMAAAEEILDAAAIAPELKVLLSDAQTSGGLLLCVNPRKLQAVQALLKEARTPAAAVIGRITRARRPRIVAR